MTKVEPILSSINAYELRGASEITTRILNIMVLDKIVEKKLNVLLIAAENIMMTIFAPDATAAYGINEDKHKDAREVEGDNI